MRYFFLFLFSSLLAFAENKPTVCLNMIVKNESAVIKRCLDSVKPVIDYWVVVDTGSTDGTQEIIKDYLKDIPGELHERPWRNFGENRTEALQLAKGKCSYILFMDADDVLKFTDKIEFPPLTSDLYNMWRGSEDFTYQKPQLVKDSLPWKWVGVTHEYLGCDAPYTSTLLETVRYVTGSGGHRSQGSRKFLENIKLLEDGLKKEPNNERYAFYLAESYRDAGEPGKALEWFQKRIKMGGWQEEVFWSRLQAALLLDKLEFPHTVVAESFKQAHYFRPQRIEPIYYLAELYNRQEKYQEAYEWIKIRDLIPKNFPKDVLFNMDWIAEYGLLFQLSICAYYTGHHQEALDTCAKLLECKNLPEAWRAQTEVNRKFPLAALEKEKEAKEQPKD